MHLYHYFTKVQNAGKLHEFLLVGKMKITSIVKLCLSIERVISRVLPMGTIAIAYFDKETDTIPDVQKLNYLTRK